MPLPKRADIIGFGQSLFAQASFLMNLKASRNKLLLVISALFALFVLLHFTLSQNALAYARTERFNSEINQAEHFISKNIWQIHLRPSNHNGTFQIDPSKIGDSASWLARNPDYAYHLVSDESASRILHENKIYNKKIRQIYRGLPYSALKSDLLRYLILAEKGGVYADTDVEDLRPIDTWIPKQYRHQAKVVVGIEFDKLNDTNWREVHPDLQICQYTIAAAPKHPLLYKMISSIVSHVEECAKKRNTTMDHLKLTDVDVIQVTGPWAWTDVVFEQLRVHDPSLKSVRDLTGLTTPTLFGDILLLPIDGFGVGQLHSNSTSGKTTPDSALIRHKFRGSWRTETEAKPPYLEVNSSTWSKLLGQ